MWLSDRPTIGDDITCIDHLVSTRNRWEGGQSPGAQVKVAVDGAGRGPVRGADDIVEVLHRGGDDVSHGGVGRLDTISRCDSVTVLHIQWKLSQCDTSGWLCPVPCHTQRPSCISITLRTVPSLSLHCTCITCLYIPTMSRLSILSICHVPLYPTRSNVSIMTCLYSPSLSHGFITKNIHVGLFFHLFTCV